MPQRLDRVEFRSPSGTRETGLPSFGEKLKQERERRKVTLEQISVSTKIGSRMLQALEEDKFNQLPGGIFNKGFVRAYARCVGLDEDQTVADYLQASGDAPPASTEIAFREDSARENAERASRLEAATDGPSRQLPWGVFAAALLVIALALSFWSHRRQENTRHPVRPAPAKSAAQLLGGPSGEKQASPALRSPANGGSPASGATGSLPSMLASTAATTDELQIVVHASQESWISATVDGVAGSSETLAPGGERTFSGRKEIILKVGNAGGIDLRFNGKKLDIGGQIGEVKTVTFGPHGIVSNTPESPSMP
jgi:cytoskeleton protein RodZ